MLLTPVKLSYACHDMGMKGKLGQLDTNACASNDKNIIGQLTLCWRSIYSALIYEWGYPLLLSCFSAVLSKKVFSLILQL